MIYKSADITFCEQKDFIPQIFLFLSICAFKIIALFFNKSKMFLQKVRIFLVNYKKTAFTTDIKAVFPIFFKIH